MKATVVSRYKGIAAVIVITAVILAVPLMAMQFTNEVQWDARDFLIIGSLLIGTGLLIVLASRKIKDIQYRAAVIIALLIALFVIWAELAVGIFATPFAGS